MKSHYRQSSITSGINEAYPILNTDQDEVESRFCGNRSPDVLCNQRSTSLLERFYTFQSLCLKEFQVFDSVKDSMVKITCRRTVRVSEDVF